MTTFASLFGLPDPPPFRDLTEEERRFFGLFGDSPRSLDYDSVSEHIRSLLAKRCNGLDIAELCLYSMDSMIRWDPRDPQGGDRPDPREAFTMGMVVASELALLEARPVRDKQAKRRRGKGDLTPEKWQSVDTRVGELVASGMSRSKASKIVHTELLQGVFGSVSKIPGVDTIRRHGSKSAKKKLG